jgi:hypothetical protein
MRDLFPRDCFKNKEYGSIEIHQLQGAKREDTGQITVTHQEAFLLTQWLERGVFHALEAEYINAMTFAIYTKHPATGSDLLLETYTFKISYFKNGDAPMINDIALYTKECVKNQAAKFIRSLTEFSGTLDELPENRWLTIQLKVLLHFEIYAAFGQIC